MNPFDLPGPDFLIFYWLLIVATWTALVIARAVSDRRGSPSEVSSDPYLVAYLRGGPPELVRIALLSLIQEGAVRVDDGTVVAVAGDAHRQRVPVETELLSMLKRPRAITAVVRDEAPAACADYERRLERQRYLRTQAAVRRGAVAGRIAVGLLLAVAGIKAAIAHWRGHHNLGLLFISGVAGTVVARKLQPGRVTRRGREALRLTQSLLEGARPRAATLGAQMAPGELLLVAAAFGVASIPGATALAEAVALPASGWSDATSWSSGSSWSDGSSSGGSSCGSSCGGGGCGGGCGGCGS